MLMQEICEARSQIMRGVQVAKVYNPSGSGGATNRSLDWFRLGQKDDWLDALDKCFELVYKQFPADFDQQGLKDKVLRIIYANTGLTGVRERLHVKALADIDESNLSHALHIEAWWQLVTLFVPPTESETDYMFRASKVVRSRESPNMRSQAEAERKAAIALRVEQEKKEHEAQARLRAAIAEAKAKKEANLAAAMAREEQIKQHKEKVERMAADSIVAVQDAQTVQTNLGKEAKTLGAKLNRQRGRVESLELAMEEEDMPELPEEPEEPEERLSPAQATPRPMLTGSTAIGGTAGVEEIVPDQPAEIPANPVQHFVQQAFSDFSIPPDAIEAIAGRVQKDLAEYIDTEGSVRFGKVLKALIGYPTNLAQICSPYMTHAYMSVENTSWGEKIVRLVDADHPVEPSLYAKAQKAFGVKRGVGEAEMTPEWRRTGSKKAKTVEPLQPLRLATPRDMGDVRRNPPMPPVRQRTPNDPMDPRLLEGLEQFTPEVESRRGSPDWQHALKSPTPMRRQSGKGKGRMIRGESEGAHSQLEREADEDERVSSETGEEPDHSSPVW
ncbi:hypothetical protein BS47DRAFT_1403173 [Hydnum rufescens UP504]|uniref:Uncharacterized protein n=1 Tax=Hydnum rufescens UP504 TaxID=1448309 RepID=A0A9P6ABA9_9AGAM|nr:hypothetical protein BS47DRAFT_1403173 [Hydnum rufescens UP504]